MDRSDTYARLTETVEDVLGIENLVLTPETTADQVEGWDSLTHLTIMVAIESRFGIRLSTQEIETMTNVGDLVRKIEGRLATGVAGG